MAASHLEPVVRQIHELVALSSAEQLPDAALLERFLSTCDQDAFTSLVRRHGPLVWRVCRRVLGEADGAADALQATFLILARRASSIRKPASLASWLHGVAFRVAREARTRRRRHLTAEALRAEPVAVVGEPGTEAAWRELGRILEEEVHNLPEHLRLPILLTYWAGETNEEAARQLRWPSGTFKARLARARGVLHRRLVKRGVTLSTGAVTLLLAPGPSQATLPGALIVATIHAAIGTVGTTRASATAATLAKGAMAGTGLTKIALVLTFAVGVAALGLGAFWTLPAGEQPGVQARPADTPARTDRYGDPLPPEAVARFGTTRFRHDGEAWSLGFGDGGKLIAGVTNMALVVWDAATGKELHRISRFEDDNIPLGLTVAPDQSTLAVLRGRRGAGGGDVVLYDLRTGERTRTLIDATNGGGRVVRFAPDGGRLGYVDHVGCHVFELASTRRYLLSANRVNDIAFSPDGRTAAVASDEQPGVRLYDLSNGRLVREAAIAGNPWISGHALAFSPDGTILAAGGRDVLILVDAATGKKHSEYQTQGMGAVVGLAFMRDGRTLIGAGQDAKVRTWDVPTGKLRQVVDGQTWFARSMALSPDGRTVALGTSGSAVRLWDVATGQPRLDWCDGHESEAGTLMFSENGRTLFSAGLNQQVRLWDATTRDTRRVWPAVVRTLSVSPDGKRLASALRDGTVRVWEPATDTETLRLPFPEDHQVDQAIFVANGKTLLTADHDMRTAELAFLKKPGGPSGKIWLRQWDAVNGNSMKEVTLPGRRLAGLHLLSENGELLLSPYRDRPRLYDLDTGRDRFALEDTKTFSALAVTPDGRGLFTGGEDRVIRLWELATGREIWHRSAHENKVRAVAVSPDGRLAASGDSFYFLPSLKEKPHPATVRIWDVVTGTELACFGELRTEVSSLAFSPDGGWLVSGMTDGTILLWDMARVTRQRGPVRPQLATGALEGLWADLADGDAAKGHRAVWALVNDPARSVPFLRDHLRAGEAEELEKIRRWVADLASDRFETREAAMRELERAGESAVPMLRETLRGNFPVEVRRRAEVLLKGLNTSLRSEAVRAVRAVEVLEQIRSKDARDMLAQFARGAPAARLTREANAALERLARLRRAATR